MIELIGRSVEIKAHGNASGDLLGRIGVIVKVEQEGYYVKLSEDAIAAYSLRREQFRFVPDEVREIDWAWRALPENFQHPWKAIKDHTDDVYEVYASGDDRGYAVTGWGAVRQKKEIAEFIANAPRFIGWLMQERSALICELEGVKANMSDTMALMRKVMTKRAGIEDV